MLKGNKLTFIFSVLALFSVETFAVGDPTKPPTYVSAYRQVSVQDDKSKPLVLKLNAIKIQGIYKIAIINGSQYKVGEIVGTNRVKSISSNKVVFVSGKTLSLFDNAAQVNIAKKGY